MATGENILGMDLSLGHAGFVELDPRGALVWYAYVSNTASGASRGANGHRMPTSKSKDRQVAHMARLVWWESFLDKEILRPRSPMYVGLEDYAYRAESNSAYQIGELGGMARILSWFRGAQLRLHDPLSMKMFATGSGNAEKDEVCASVRDQWGVDFARFNASEKNHDVEYDLADAYVAARMVWTEVELRAGRMKLSDLDAKRVRVFNRVTKAYPVNLLDRDFIHDPSRAPGNVDKGHE